MGCQTNPPTSDNNNPSGYGKIFITANVDSSSIFIDNVYSGKVTPDTVETTVGIHEVRVEKENYLPSVKNVEVLKNQLVRVDFVLQPASVNKVVLLEDFANVSCFPCVTSNQIIHSLVNNTYGHDKLVAIKYPTNFPSPNDPFYQSNSADCNARINFYDILSAPTTIIDGTERPISTDSTSVKSLIDQQLLVTPKFYVDVTDSIAGSVYYIKVTVRVLDESGLDFPNIVLQTVVTETDIVFDNPPGANGETEFFDVMRVMLPTNEGESLNGIDLSNDVVFKRQTAINSNWNAANLHTIAFIQNKLTKEVYQANSTY